jgi:hypothetical protein
VPGSVLIGDVGCEGGSEVGVDTGYFAFENAEYVLERLEMFGVDALVLHLHQRVVAFAQADHKEVQALARSGFVVVVDVNEPVESDLESEQLALFGHRPPPLFAFDADRQRVEIIYIAINQQYESVPC